jgi:beta-glucanase (GH16 family)
MMPTEDKYGSWASSGEIDIMEFKGQEIDQVWGTLHHGESWPKNKHSGTQYKLKSGNFCDDFHVYGLEWEEGKIRWYVDGTMYQEQTQWSSSGGKFPAPFNHDFHMLLNLAVGGGFVGDPPNAQTPFPSQFLVDYVRVYQQK